MTQKKVEFVRTRFALGIDYEADISATFASALREATKDPNATSFIKRAGELHPKNDLDLAMFIIGQNVRQKVRQFIKFQINSGGLIGRVSPVKQTLLDEPEFLEVRDVPAQPATNPPGEAEERQRRYKRGPAPDGEPAGVSPGVSESDGGDAD